MAVVTTNLGVVTAYGYAKQKGYTGTEAEFAQLMADLNAISFTISVDVNGNATLIRSDMVNTEGVSY